MEKKNHAHYLILFCAIITSFSLLTVSYSSYSGSNNEPFINKERDNNFIITYKTENNINLKEETELDFAITNRDPRARSIALYLVEKNEQKSTDIKYRLNNEEIKNLTDEPIAIVNFNAFGEEDDFKSFHLELISENNVDKNLNFMLKIIEIDKTTNTPVSSVEETN